MANGYKAPSGLSSAVRGRSMVKRDYTAGLKREAADREATLGLVQSIAGGVAAASSAIGENVKSWDKAEAGAREVFESSGIEGSFDESGYKGADNWMDRWFKSAGEVSDTQIIGDREFSTSNLIEIGSVDSVTASKMADRTYDDLGNPTGRMSLYESEGKALESGIGGMTLESKSKAPKFTQPEGNERTFRYRESDVDSSQVIKNNVVKDQKQNATGGLASDPQTNPLEGESFRQYNERLRSMDLNPEDFNYSQLSESLYGKTKKGDSGIDFSSIESVEVPSLPKAENKDNNRGFAFTYKGEEVDFSELIGNLFKKTPEMTENEAKAKIGNILDKRMKEKSLSTSP